MYYLNKKSSRFNKSSNQRALPIYITFRILIIALLGYSVWATVHYLSDTWLKGFEYSLFIGAAIGVALAFFISKILSYVITEYLVDNGRISWVVVVLISFISINSYFDWQGVNLYSENNIKDIIYTSNVDSLYNLQRQDLNIQLADLNQIISSNKDWNKYSPKNGKWTKHTKWKKATIKKEKINDELQKLASNHNANKANELSIYKDSKTKREAKVKLLSDSFRGGVLACNVLIILLSYWCSKYEYDYSQLSDRQVRQPQTDRQTEVTNLSDFKISPDLGGVTFTKDLTNEAIKKRLIKGMSLRDIAKEVGCTKYKVEQVKKELDN